MKKVIARAKMEGDDERWTIKCDMDSEGDRVWAVLRWGLGGEWPPRTVYRLRPELLCPSQRTGVDFVYDNDAEPIPLTKDLLRENSPFPFENGFFRIQ